MLRVVPLCFFIASGPQIEWLSGFVIQTTDDINEDLIGSLADDMFVRRSSVCAIDSTAT